MRPRTLALFLLWILSVAGCAEAPREPPDASQLAAWSRAGSSGAAVGAGLGHTCMLGGDGSVSCVGLNSSGQLGDGSSTSRLSPVVVAGVDGAVALAIGNHHSCALLADGGVRCWGANHRGQIGDGTTTARSTAVSVSGLTDAVWLAAGGNHTCAVRAGGGVTCWGENTYGQIGIGTTSTSQTTPATVALYNVAEVSAGESHTCARGSSGSVQCWGRNAYGQLGDGTTTNRLTPTAVSGIASATSLDAGGYHTCASSASDGLLRCWGSNSQGQIGDGTYTQRRTPVIVQSWLSTDRVSAGLHHTCAVRSNGSTYCWGYNAYGQVGDGTTVSPRTTPRFVSGASMAGSVAAGAYHTCVVSLSAVRCWGYNSYGQLGDGTTTHRSSGVPVQGFSRESEAFVQIASGDDHVCALDASGAVSCSGANHHGQLGDGGFARRSTFEPSAANGVTAIAAGAAHTCALRTNGYVLCWGRGGSGQLGSGAREDSALPGWVTGVQDAVAITAGRHHTCALRADGAVLCWGRNDEGQLGDGTTADRLTAVEVSGLSNVSLIAAGGAHSCAVVQGKIRCWGRNDEGQLGDGTTVSRTTPTASAGGTIVAIAAGGEHTCKMHASGSVYCWGANYGGQLGNGTWLATLSSTGGTAATYGASGISAGAAHTCALLADGQAKCWGHHYRQAVNQAFLVPDSGVAGWTDIAAGALHTCFLDSTGEIACWGYDEWGQHGSGDEESTMLPGATVPEYHVATTGDDAAGDGTIGAPWRTIAHALDEMDASHAAPRIMIAAGEYPEWVTVREPAVLVGDAGGGTILSYPGTSAPSDGRTRVYDGRILSFAVATDAPHPITLGLEDLAVTGPTTSGRYGFKVDGDAVWALRFDNPRPAGYGEAVMYSPRFLIEDLVSGRDDGGSWPHDFHVDVDESRGEIVGFVGVGSVDHAISVDGGEVAILGAYAEGGLQERADGIRIEKSADVAIVEAVLTRTHTSTPTTVGETPAGIEIGSGDARTYSNTLGEWLPTVSPSPRSVLVADSTSTGFTYGLLIGGGRTLAVDPDLIQVRTSTLSGQWASVRTGCATWQVPPLMDLGGGPVGSPGDNVIGGAETLWVENLCDQVVWAYDNAWPMAPPPASRIYDDADNAAYGTVLF